MWSLILLLFGLVIGLLAMFAEVNAQESNAQQNIGSSILSHKTLCTSKDHGLITVVVAAWNTSLQNYEDIFKEALKLYPETFGEKSCDYEPKFVDICVLTKRFPREGLPCGASVRFVVNENKWINSTNREWQKVEEKKKFREINSKYYDSMASFLNSQKVDTVVTYQSFPRTVDQYKGKVIALYGGWGNLLSETSAWFKTGGPVDRFGSRPGNPLYITEAPGETIDQVKEEDDYLLAAKVNGKKFMNGTFYPHLSFVGMHQLRRGAPFEIDEIEWLNAQLKK